MHFDTFESRFACANNEQNSCNIKMATPGRNRVLVFVIQNKFVKLGADWEIPVRPVTLRSRDQNSRENNAPQFPQAAVSLRSFCSSFGRASANGDTKVGVAQTTL